MKRLLFLLLILTGFGTTYSQLPSPDTILITECYLGAHSGVAFMEITNMGTSPVNLERYFLLSGNVGQSPGSGPAAGSWRLSGTVQPGQAFVIMGNYKREVFGSPDPNDSVDWTPAYYRNFDYDLMTPNFVLNPAVGKPGWDAFWPRNGTATHGIGFDTDGDGVWNPSNGDIIIDQVGLTAADGGGANIIPDVAGIIDALRFHVLIRKSSINLGNYGDFKSGQGVGSEDSDWIVVPFFSGRTQHFFKTLKLHGNTFPWQVTSSTVNIGEDQIVVPWGIRRDSLYMEFDFGDNMAWYIRWGADTAYSVVTQTADTFYMYLAGDEVTTRIYPVTVSPPADNMNLVFPAFDRNAAGNLFLRYVVTDKFEMDTISNIPFGTRVDTLLKYLEKAPAASWRLEFEGGESRADLKTGDKLVVTAVNNDVKEYYIELNEYEPNSNAQLGAIYLYGDTIYGFRSNVLNYTEYLAPETDFPALTAQPVNLNATVHIERPKNIRGGREDRTAKIHVTAADDTTILTYSVTFEIMRMTESFHADPFFSSVINGIANFTPGATNASGWGKGWEIFNPGNTVVPLSDYIIANSTGGTFANIISSTNMTPTMRPGYTMDSTRLAVGIYYNERAYPFITDMDPGRVVVFGRGNYTVGSGWVTTANAFFHLCDFRDTNGNLDAAMEAWGFVDGNRICFFTDGNSFYLIRIDNDSIFNGTKAGGDPNDYTLVDIFGAQGTGNHRLIEGEFVGHQTAKVLVRRSHIWKGNPENHGSHGTEPGTGEWDIYQGAMYIGTHPYDPYTGYISTVNSIAYRVSPDYGENQTIGIVPPGTTASVFLSNIFADGEDAVLTLTNAGGDVERTDENLLVDGDRLTVVSGTGENTTVYTISLETPSSNAVLTSSVYTVNVGAEGGQVSGIPALTTIEDMLPNLTVPTGATLTVIDVLNQQVGTEKVLYDTLYIVKTMVSDIIKLEVLAEDGATKILYDLLVNVENPYLTSDYYLVLQDRLLIDMFQSDILVSNFLNRVVPSFGSTVTVTDKLGNPRGTEELMFKDDRILVSNGAQTTVYHLKAMLDLYSDDASLKDLMVNGTTVEGFDPALASYNIVLDQSQGMPDLPEVTVLPNYYSSLVSIDQAVNLTGTIAERTATITVKAEDGVTQAVYTIVFDLNVGLNQLESKLMNIWADGRTVCIQTNSLNQGDRVEIYNVAGRLILSRQMQTTYERIQITDPAGIYIVKVKTGGDVFVEKVIMR